MNQSVERAFKIIEVLAFEEIDELSVTEISKKTGLNIVTTYRFLVTLGKLGLIEKNSKNKKYRITLELFRIGSNIIYKKDKNIVNYSIEQIKSLSKKYNETINLSTFENGQVIYVYKITSSSNIKYDIKIGSQHPAYCTAAGKIFLSYQNDEFFNSYFNKIKLLKYTEHTIVDKNQIKKQLKSIKKKGFAFDKEEYINGANCIAVPIFGLDNEINYAISISIPHCRIRNYNILDIVNDLLKSSNEVSKMIK